MAPVRGALVAAAAACILLVALAPQRTAAGAGEGECADGCTCPCSCAYGFNFGESLCNYANTTRDIKDFQATLAKKSPDWQVVNDIYYKGKYTVRSNGGVPSELNPIGLNTMVRVAKTDYKPEVWWVASREYFGSPTFLDDIMGPAVKGEGDFAAGSCCGVRAETLIAASRWWHVIYGLHEMDNGFCWAPGYCAAPKNRSIGAEELGYETAAEEIIHALPLFTGANQDGVPSSQQPAGTRNPSTLFSVTNKLSGCRSGAQSMINQLTLQRLQAASDAAAARASKEDLQALIDQVYDITAARFLQYSLDKARAAGQTLSGSQRRAINADACRKGCWKAAQQAAARVYLKAVEAWIHKSQPELLAQAIAILDAPSVTRKSAQNLAKIYSDIAASYGLKKNIVNAVCNPQQ